MTKISALRSAALAGAILALGLGAPALALTPEEEIRLYDQPRQIDGFLLNGSAPAFDVEATGSVVVPEASASLAPAATADEPFFANHERIRLQSDYGE
ncbi:hypothetical protein [Salinarimonas sp.]|uniref:hypothetical protein n=1 Tax=Salinarimonas sp. TaxID=2766526 RepID=UPI00391B44AC